MKTQTFVSLFAVLLGLLAAIAYGDTKSEHSPLYLRSLYYLQEAQEKVQQVGSQCMSCEAFAAGKPASTSCQKNWDQFYKRTTVDLRLFLGYTDYGKSVRDGRIAQALIDMITQKNCEPGVNLCGFESDPDDDRYFYKPIWVNGRRKTVRLQIAWSSASDDDDANTGRAKRSSLKDEQTQRTEVMKKLFADSLQNADATLYYGHARYGAGPDFGPPKRLANGERDSAYYKNPKHHDSKQQLLKNLRQAKRPTKILGFFGCSGEDLFGDEIHKAAPKTATLLPEGLTYAESSVVQMYGALDSILGRRCEADFEAATNALPKIEVVNKKKEVHEIDVPPVRFENFFR